MRVYLKCVTVVFEKKGGAIHINLFVPFRSMMTSWAYDSVVDDFASGFHVDATTALASQQLGECRGMEWLAPQMFPWAESRTEHRYMLMHVTRMSCSARSDVLYRGALVYT